MNHFHCETCFRPFKCQNTCQIVKCLNLKCIMVMHKCKLNEHLLICQFEKVLCLNHDNGCPEELLRKDISGHLTHCSASVVHCSQQWQRRPLHKSRPLSGPALDSSDLGVALAERDERMLCEYFEASEETQRVFRKSISVPLKPYRGQHEVTKEAKGHFKAKLDFSAVVDQSHAQTPLPSLGLEIRALSSEKRESPRYTFRCAQEMRRDEYYNHYKNIHNDVINHLDQWLQYKCPLSERGCPFVAQRWRPLPEGSKLVFSSLLESFGHKMAETEAEVYSDGQEVTISVLPVEILRNICRFLDSFAFNNLSLTSQRFRDICRSFLDRRGMVSLHWQRTRDQSGKINWKNTKKKWLFSPAFHPIRDWRLVDSHVVWEHLKTCPHYVLEPKLEPFRLPQREDEEKKHI